MNSSEAERNVATRRKHSFGYSFLRIATVIASGYVAILATLAFNETSLVYPGSKYPGGDWDPVGFDHEQVEFRSKDNTKLVGWYLRKPIMLPNSGPDRTVLVCHGNAENVAQSAGYTGACFREALGADVFAFDYRGYGKSEGSPHEAGVLADSEAALEWLCEKTGKSPDEIILVGNSLGGGAAVHLASKCGCKMLILQRTFSSLTDAAQHNYPWLPVRYFMRNQYPSCDKIKNCRQPLFQTHPAEDTLIPVESAIRLFESSPAQKKQFHKLDGLGHFDPFPNAYWQDLRRFVDEVDGNR